MRDYFTEEIANPKIDYFSEEVLSVKPKIDYFAEEIAQEQPVSMLQRASQGMADIATNFSERLEAGETGAIKSVYDTISGLVEFSRKHFEPIRERVEGIEVDGVAVKDMPKISPEIDEFISGLSQKAKQKFLQSNYVKQKEKVMKEHPIATKVGGGVADIGLLVAASAIPGSVDDVAVITKLAVKYPKIALAVKSAARSGKTFGIFGFVKELAKTKDFKEALKAGGKSGGIGALLFGPSGAITNPIGRTALLSMSAHALDKIPYLRGKYQRGEEITLKDVAIPSLQTILLTALSIIQIPAHQRAIKLQRQTIMKTAKQELMREPKSYKEAVETLKKAKRVILPGGKEATLWKKPQLAVFEKGQYIKPEGKIISGRGSKMVDAKGRDVFKWDKTFKEYRPVITQAGKAPKIVEMTGTQQIKAGGQKLTIPYKEKVTIGRAREIAGQKAPIKPAVKAPVGKGVKVYHGTTRDFETFDASKLSEATGSKSGRAGFWFTDDISTAKSYSKAENEKIVGKLLKQGKRKEAEELENKIFAEKDPRFIKEVSLDLKNPKIIDAKGKRYNDLSDVLTGDDTIQSIIAKAKAEGRDGLIIKNLSDHADYSVYKPANHYLVFDAKNIKTKPKPTPEVKGLEPLKYDSVEEFVKGQGGVDEKTPNVYWHGSASGDLRGGRTGLHIGTKGAATIALEARIGIPADGKGWTGNREYGKTLLAGKKSIRSGKYGKYRESGFNVDIPENDFYPTQIQKYADKSEMPMTVKPRIEPYKIKGQMTNTPETFHEDFKAGGYMAAQKKKGTAKKGYFYKNISEDEGSISATVPSGKHLEPLKTKAQLTSIYNKATAKVEKKAEFRLPDYPIPEDIKTRVEKRKAPQDIREALEQGDWRSILSQSNIKYDEYVKKNFEPEELKKIQFLFSKDGISPDIAAADLMIDHPEVGEITGYDIISKAIAQTGKKLDTIEAQELKYAKELEDGYLENESIKDVARREIEANKRIGTQEGNKSQIDGKTEEESLKELTEFFEEKIAVTPTKKITKEPIKITKSNLQELSDYITNLYKVPKIKIEISDKKHAKGKAVYHTWRIKGKKIHHPDHITVYDWKDISVSEGDIAERLGHELAHHITNVKKRSLAHTDYMYDLADDLGGFLDKKLKKIKKPAEIVKAPSGMATVGTFAKDTEVKLGNIDKIKPVEFPELVEITKDLMGRVPEVSKRLRTALGKFYGTERGRIKLTPEIFKKENADQLAKTLAHEIGHLVDYLPQQTLRRGNLLGSLLSMRRFLKNTYGVVNITNKELREELKTVSKYWRPWDESMATASFKNYRNSSRELYADSISMLLNNPGRLEELAPQFYKSFFDNLDKKPEVKDAYFKLQEVLSHDRETLIKLRRERVRGMFTQADYKSKELQDIKEKERKIRLKDFWEMFTYGVKSVNQPVYRKVEMLRKRGVHIPDEENPEYLLSSRNYLSGLVKGEFKQNIQPIMKNLLENDIDWKTFGESLYYDRITAGDRSEFANPRGITPKAAEELSASIKESLGDRYKIIETNANKFREFLKGLSEKAYKEGMFTKEMFDIVKGNEKYVPFQVVEYMENYVAWKTKPQVGTLKDITNPANSLLLKAVSTIRAIEGQKIRKATFKMLEENFPDEIQEAKLQFTGKAQRPMPSKDPKLKMITYYKEGKLRGKYVDPYIAKSLENDTIAANKAVMTLLSPVRYLNRKLFRPLFVVYNPGWIPFNFIRDFDRAWKNIPGMSMYRLLKLYGKAIRPAKVRAFGLKEGAREADIKAEALITKLEKEEILSITWNDFLMGQTTEDVQIETIFEQMGLAESKKEIPTIVKGFDKVLNKTGIKPILEWIRDTGSMIETLSKVAGYYELKGKMSPQEMRTFLRRNVGSPDFFEKGYLTAATNDVFLFSNAFIQAVSADTNIAVNPKTRSGFWWKTTKVAFLPKLLMFLAVVGAFGKKIKDMMSDASEYDLTNYIVIPLGRDSKNGKTIYLRIPTDESSRLLGGVMWKGMNSFKNNQPFMRDMADVASLFGGQLPGLSPAIEAPLSTAQFLTGKNPYDSFRGRLALSRTEMDAGGWYAAKPFLMWQYQQMGGNIFMKLYAGERTPTEKSTGEKILRSPIISNVVGRFIKISDYGSIERYRKTMSIEKQKRARKSIDENRILSDYVGKYQKGIETKRKLFDKMAIEILGHRPKNSKERDKKRRLGKKFKIAILRGRADPIINSFISAWTNNEKLELLKVFKGDMSESEFKELKKTLRKHRIVNSEILRRVR